MHLVGILFPHINDDARSKSHQIHICCSGLGSKIRLTLCKIIGSYSPVSEDSGVKEYDTVLLGEWFVLL